MAMICPKTEDRCVGIALWSALLIAMRYSKVWFLAVHIVSAWGYVRRRLCCFAGCRDNTRMGTIGTERVLTVHHWNETVFSFTTTRDQALRFENGHFIM